jgi:peptidoglycan hydrolase-like protein with peptidoglycan-binding domain
MKIMRPALLVLLTSSLAGLGVPAGFGQATATQKVSTKKKAVGTSKASTAKSQHATSATTPGKRAPAKSSAKSATKGSGKSSQKSRKQPGQKTPTRDRISEIQMALARNGSFQGSPNGQWDDETSAAMRKFQGSHGLNPTGKLDAPTLQRLGLGSQTAGVAAPTPPPGATSRLTSSASSPSTSADSPRRQ